MTNLGTITFLCGLLGATLVQAAFQPPAVLNLGPEVTKEKLTQKLKDHGAITILQDLPLFNAMQEESAKGFFMFSSLVNSVLKYIIWLKVTSANILQLEVQPSDYDQELVLRIPLDMVAGFNTPLVKSIVEFQMQTEVQALIRVEKKESGSPRLVLSDCSSSQGSLRVSLLYKLSFMVNSLADKVMNLLVPALPKMVKNQLCPVIQEAFDDMYADLLKLVKAPIALSPGALEFDLLSLAIEDSNIQFNLKAKLLDSQAKATKWFNSSTASLTEPILDDAPFSLVVRQDLVNGIVGALLPAEELLVLLDFVLPEVARELQADIKGINEQASNKLGPTQIVKIVTKNTPRILLNQDSAKAAQKIVLEVFPTNKDVRPFFSLGIDANSDAYFYTEGDKLMLNLNDISTDRIQLMISDIDLFNPELLKGTVTKILTSALLPNENGKLRPGIPMSLAKSLGYERSVWSMTKVVNGRMLLLCLLPLCWGLLPQIHGKTHSPIFLRVNQKQLETNISELLSEREILKRVVRMPVTGAHEGVSVLGHLPFVKTGFVEKSSGLDLSLVGDLLSGKTAPVLKEVLETGGLVIEDAKGPEVTLQILSDSLLQITLRCKLYLSLQGILWLKVIKNIRIGVRLEQTGNETQVALEECDTPPGYLNIDILKPTDSLLANKLLKLVASTLDKSLPFLLQKIVCPVATNLLNSLLEDLLRITLPPIISGPYDFQYYVTTTEFTEGAILMRVQLVTPCSPGQRAPRPEYAVSPALPGLAQDSMADLAFWLEIYNDILSCLYTSHKIQVDPEDSTDDDLLQLLTLRSPRPESEASHQSIESLGLVINTPEPPTIQLVGSMATVIQRGSLVLQGPNNTSSGAVLWQLHSEAMFSSRNQKLRLQFTPHSAMVTLDSYPTTLEKQEEHLKVVLLAFLKRRFLPGHNEWLRKHDLPLPNIKGISFSHAQVDFSKDYILLTVPE